MTIKAVVFDIGNVLIEWQPEKYFDRVLGKARCSEMFDEVDIHGMMVKIDAGNVFADVVEDTAAGHAKWRQEVLKFRWKWTEIAQPEIPESVKLLRALKAKGVPVFALSNFGKENFPLSEAQFPFLKEFDRRYISGEMKLIKPDPEIYAAVEADCGLAPESLFFTDDREDNIAAAAARGWQTHRFETPEGLARSLVGHGLLTQEDIT
ncbi:haloacid dehalogenase [Roseovarius sp. HI0049]|nr:haloacid dehalogenase [Roseovarius sp. HI0049]KZY43807.1 haloacid dehalogenase [Roseovarius sp. HI0049]